MKKLLSLHDYKGPPLKHPERIGDCKNCKEVGLVVTGWASHPDWDGWGCPPETPGASFEWLCFRCWNARCGDYT